MNLADSAQRTELEAVIRRLVGDALRQATPDAGGADAGGADAGGAAQPKEVGTHSLSDPVVSLGVLERLPDGVHQVEIAPRAVVTPAAADRLREQEIRVLRGNRADGRTTSAGFSAAAASQWIADADHPERAAGYLRQLVHRGVAARAMQLPLSDGATGSVGVVIAEIPAVHVDHFARVGSLPAAAVSSLSDVGKIAAAMTPAVWVLDGDRLSFSGRIAVAAECFRVSRSATETSSAASASTKVGRPR